MKRELEEQEMKEEAGAPVKKGVTTSTEYYLQKPQEVINGYVVDKGIGTGVYSSVYKCTYANDDSNEKKKEYAVKIIRKNKMMRH